MGDINVVVANLPWHYKDLDNRFQMGVIGGSRWPFTVDYEKDAINRYRPFPFFLAHTQSYLTSKNINSVFIDAITQGSTYTKFYNEISELKPKYIIAEISTPSVEDNLRVLENISKISKVIVVGTHATVFADQLIKLPYIYAVIKGEYELSAKEAVTSGKSKIYDYQNTNIDNLPFPYRDPKLIWNYRERTHGNTPFQISIMTSRGCLYNCKFCQWPRVLMNNNLRERSVDNIRKEISELIKTFGNDIFLYVDDDSFNLKNNRTQEISKMIGEFGLKWSAMCRIDTSSKETFKIMVDNGLTHINIGIESGSPIIQKSLGKNLSLNKARENIQYLKCLGVYTHCTFTFGLPGETKKDIELTKKFYDEIEVDSKQESRAIPLPGTPWWNSLSQEERDNIDYDGKKSLGNNIL